MQMDVGLDTGPVYCMEKLTIGPLESAGELHVRLATLGGDLLARTLDAILDGKVHPVAQSVEGVTYARRINKVDGQIDWSKSAVDINNSIHAYNPWPVAQTSIAGEPLRCWSSCLAEHSANESMQSGRVPGQVLGTGSAGLKVQTGNGVLVLTEVQAPGRKRLTALDFVNSRSLDDVILGR
jgi:methionyl-tRNA formyltransferase